MAPKFNLSQIGTNAIIGGADGVLARKDITGPNWNQPRKHKSLWLEGGAVIGGLVLGSYAKSPQTQMMAESAVLTGGALLARRVGVYIAEQQETPKPTYPTTQPTYPPMVASAQVMRGAVAAEYVNSPGRVTLRQQQNRFI